MALLEVKAVQVKFNGFLALRGLDLTVEAGELRCLIGPNGAGKTTALDVICGKARPSAGEITFDGHKIGRLDEHRIARLGVGRKFQVPSVFRELTVRENLAVAQSRPSGIFSNLVPRKQRDPALQNLAEFVGLADVADEPAGNLSHGQTQWLEIAMLMAQDSRLILLDEPTAGMTAAETRKTAELCRRLKGQHSLIVVEHDMGFIREIGDVISVMHQGKLLAQGTVAEIEVDPQVKEAYLGSGGISHA
ncbi:MAG: urea ABC transporter ATP-binding protein UrtD [Rhodospirillales bacterium 20-64-7]|nr:MAG: urea ABC transporter ATP-binding protein UrtD [Rhodospirillales bacterium 20-64-7]